MSEFIPVTDKPGLVRDPRSGAILNINKSDVEKARAAKQARLNKEQQQAQLRRDVDNLKSDISDIKSMLAQLVEKI